LEGKLDVVKDEYWSKGIDTDLVPEDILTSYLKQDVLQTWEVFEMQQTRITLENRTLLSLANQDLLALEEIEFNGMVYNVPLSRELGDAIQIELDATDIEMRSFLDTPEFKPSSNDHVSAALYGGIIKWPSKENYTFTYKDGRTAEKVRSIVVEKVMPRLVSPLKGSAVAKEGYYATNEPTLLSLKVVGAVKKFLHMLINRSGLEKRRGTYLHGLPNMMEEMDWDPSIIHGQLNQCVAITGRLSSSKPNMQNFDKKISNLFISRYPE
jgi:DNA polymerase I-like protein with 3'-5' exonuclease and polymerase domains